MKISFEYFENERSKFQEIMGLKSYTVEQVSDSMRGLLYTYLVLCQNPDVSKGNRESAVVMMQSAAIEHDRRLMYRLSQ